MKANKNFHAMALLLPISVALSPLGCSNAPSPQITSGGRPSSVDDMDEEETEGCVESVTCLARGAAIEEHCDGSFEIVDEHPECGVQAECSTDTDHVRSICLGSERWLDDRCRSREPVPWPCEPGYRCEGEGNCVPSFQPPTLPPPPPLPDPDDKPCSPIWNEQPECDGQDLVQRAPNCEMEQLLAHCPLGCKAGECVSMEGESSSDDDAPEPGDAPAPLDQPESCGNPTLEALCIGNGAALVSVGCATEPIAFEQCGAAGCVDGVCIPCETETECIEDVVYQRACDGALSYVESCPFGCEAAAGLCRITPELTRVNVRPALDNFYCAQPTNGDQEFSGKTEVTVDARLDVFEDRVEIVVAGHWREPVPDHTEGEVVMQEVIYAAPPACSIYQVVSPALAGQASLSDGDHSADRLIFGLGSPVSSVMLYGDTPGDDLGLKCDQGKDAGIVSVSFPVYAIDLECD